MNKNILITSAGRRVSLVRAFMAELKKHDSNAKVFCADANPKLASACHVADAAFEVIRVTEPNYIENLIALCQQNSIGMVVPTIDTELLVLANNKELLAEHGILALVADESFVKICRDKRLTSDFFRSKDFNVAKEMDKESITYPTFVKPYDGSRSVDTFLLRSADDMTEYIMEHDRLMFMEYLDHDYHTEYTIDLYYTDKGDLKCIVPRKRIEVRDGEVNKALAIKNHLMDYIKSRLGNIKGARGCLTLQVFVNENTNEVYGIEINPRFGGGYPLSYLAGANFQKWLIEEYYEGKNIEYFDGWENNLVMLRYDHEVLVHDYKD